MPATKPYSGTSVERLVELINHDNNSSLVIGTDFTFGELKSASSSGGRNTTIRMIPTEVPKYREQDIKYRRLSLDVLGYLPEGFIEKVRIEALPFKIHDILPAINLALGLDLTPEEVLNTEYTNPQMTYTLTIAGPLASIAWLPSSYNFAVDADFIGSRVSENGAVRIMEDGTPRMLELEL